MTAVVRARAPWLVWVGGMLLLAATLSLSVLNGSLSKDPFFIPLAVAMILGYSTVGALLASRNPRNPIGWLMIAVGILFALSGLTGEYVTYAYVTNPGSVPLGVVAALLTNSVWPLMIGAIMLLALLFPTGRVPSQRWRYLPPAMVGLALILFIGTVLTPGPIDTGAGVRIINPIGVEPLGSVIDIAGTIGGIGLMLSAIPAILAVVLRFKRSQGEERQQIRWLAYVAGTLAAVIVAGVATGLVVGSSFGNSFLSELFFYVGFALLGIGVPVAMGVAVLRYRLYDLDLVVKKTVMYATVAVLLTAVFLVVAVAIGGIAGRTETSAIVAAAAIGVSLWPALRIARRLADRVVYGGRATPYEVLTSFSERLSETYSTADVLPRTAQLLAGATGAAGATVWLHVGRELRPAASWPQTAVASPPVPLDADELPWVPADWAEEVRDRGELLGALAVDMPASDPIDPTRQRLLRDLAAQAGLVLRNVRLIEELRESRRRLVAAQDEERRRIERNIHDGAQQQLVALSVQLRLVEGMVEKDPARAAEQLSSLQAATTVALEDLRDLARGIYPPLLADRGLPAALEAQATKISVPTTVEADGVGRYAQDIEAAVYFCCLEALQNITKYANASTVRVKLGSRDGDLVFDVTDDGVGFDPATVTYGTGLQGMADRLDAIGGTLDVRSEPGRGTTVAGTVPVRPAT